MANDFDPKNYRRPRETRGDQRENGNNKVPPKAPRGIGFFLLLSLLVTVLVLVIFNGQMLGGSVEKLSASEFDKKLNNHEIKSITIHSSDAMEAGAYKVTGEYAAGRSSDQAARFETMVGKEDLNSLRTTAERNNVSYEYVAQSSFFSTLVQMLLPILIVGLLIWFLFFRRGMGVGGPGGVFSFGRSRAKMFNKEEVAVRFADVAGVDEAKAELSEIVEFLKNPGRFTRIGAKIPRGVVMFGPPGCGKTLLAKAIAGEAERPFFGISGSDFVEMFVGVGASRVRDLFRTAKENAPCIVFIDEIDAVGRKRGTGMGGGHDEREQTLNAILVEMDGIGTEEGIIVVAATNRPDVLDPALLRPGRFDRQVVIDLPDANGRKSIFAVHTAKVKLADGIDLDELAHATPGFSGADIANMINEAALATVLDNRDKVQMADLLEARDKVRFGRQKKSRVMDEDDRRLTAYHEAGHTVVQYLTEHTDPVHKVTIIPRGMALGATMSLPEKDRYSLTKQQAEEMLMVLYGGRIAEQMFLGGISSGAENDIERATELATNMTVRFGFSEALGPVNYAEIEERDFLGGGLTRLKGHSNETAARIDSEIRSILDRAYASARDLIAAHRNDVERIGQALLKYETLDAADVKHIMQGGEIDEKRARDRENQKRAEAARKLEEAEAVGRQRKQNLAETPSASPTPNPA